MFMRKSNLFLLYLLINIFLLLVMGGHAFYRQKAALPGLQEKSELVRSLQLTDLCLFTEASYTRHLTQANLHTPFQDSPLSLDHFPSGSILPPPKMIERGNGKLD